jgi:hypothetical protein
MTKEFYATVTYNTNHSTYGGEIEIEDFNTDKPNKNRISNQVNADELQNEMNQRKVDRDKEKQYKQMTLEELRAMKIISNTNGRPSSTLTDEKWQKEFNVRKLFVKPISPKSGIKKMRCAKNRYSIESGTWNEELHGTYYGCTNWQQYCSYIDDVLKTIRSGQVDYCYYMNQIMDLLRFHYEDLRTRYCDGYWEVWLERK